MIYLYESLTSVTGSLELAPQPNSYQFHVGGPYSHFSLLLPEKIPVGEQDIILHQVVLIVPVLPIRKLDSEKVGELLVSQN